LPTIQEPRKIPQEDQVIRQEKVLENIKKKTKTEKINDLYTEFFERKEEIEDLRYRHWRVSTGLPPKIKEEVEQLQEENQPILELIEAQGHKYLPENWDEGRYSSRFVPAEEFEEIKENYKKRKNGPSCLSQIR
jgi:hypothetical protein